MHHNDRLPGTISTSLPTLRASGRRGRKDHAGGVGRRVSILVSRPARKLVRVPAFLSWIFKGVAGCKGWPTRSRIIHSRSSCSFFSFSAFPGTVLPGGGCKTRGSRHTGRRRSVLGIFCQPAPFWKASPLNWQAAVLQLGSLVLLSSFLYQRGVPHSLNPRKAKHEARMAQSRALHLALPPFASPGVFAAFSAFACVACRFRRQSLQRRTLACGASAASHRGVHPFGSILDDNSANLAGGISRDRALCRAHHLSASAGLTGIEAG